MPSEVVLLLLHSKKPVLSPFGINFDFFSENNFGHEVYSIMYNLANSFHFLYIFVCQFFIPQGNSFTRSCFILNSQAQAKTRLFGTLRCLIAGGQNKQGGSDFMFKINWRGFPITGGGSKL